MTELLAPAGNIEGLRLAIAYGADAVYIGAPGFNARQKAEGFEDIKAAVDYCHLFGVKCYIAMNIALKDSELSRAEDMVKECVAAKADAFIIADLSLFNIIKRLSPDTPVHASTQMGTHNAEGAIFLERLGFDRVILSRETKLEDIINIKKNTKLQIECFAHGALCVAFSGACLMSALRTGQSGNRGRCLQPCRQEYTSFINGVKQRTGYLLSTSDLCSGAYLHTLIEAGVDCFKIEGRLRRPEYVGAVTGEYKKAIGDKNYKIDSEKIKKLYNRGDFTAGYNFSEDIIYDKTPGHIGIYAGKVEKVKNGICTLVSKLKLSKGDSFKIVSEGTEKGSAIFYNSISDNEYLLRYNGDVRNGCEARLTTDSDLIQEINSLAPKVPLCLTVKENTVTYSAFGISVKGEIPDGERGRYLDAKEVEAQLIKTGDTDFKIAYTEINCGKVNAAKSQLNALRRELLEELKNKILLNYKRSESKNNIVIDFGANKKYAHENLALVDETNFELFNSGLPEDCAFVFCPSDYKRFMPPVCARKVYLYLPVLAYGKDIRLFIEKIREYDYAGIMCGNYYGAELALEMGLPFIADYNFNITNSINPITHFSHAFVISPELTNEEIGACFDKGHLYAYGYLPLMTLAHNVQKVAGGKEGKIIYRDRKFGYNIDKVQADSLRFLLKNPFITDILDKIEDKRFLLLLDCRGAGKIDLERMKGKSNKSSASTQGLYGRGVN